MAASGSRVRLLARAFLDWWLGELKSTFVPATRLLRPNTILSLTVSDPECILPIGRGRRAKELARFNIETDGDRPERLLAKVAKSAKLRRSELAVILPPHQALRKRLQMPDLSEADLR